MIYKNNAQLKAWLATDHEDPEVINADRFNFDDAQFEESVHHVLISHVARNREQAEVRAAHALILEGKFLVDSPIAKVRRALSWKVAWAVAVLILLAVIAAKAEPDPQAKHNLLAIARFGPPVPAQVGGGIVIQLQNGGSTLATRGGGLVVFNCTGSSLSCAFSGSTFTLTGSAGGGTGCVPPGTAHFVILDDGAGGCSSTTPSTAGKVLISNGTGSDPTFQDPFVSGPTAHDAVGTSTNPVLVGGYASAAAPTDVSADGDATRLWVLRNGSPVVNSAAGGTLITADSTSTTSTHGIDVNIRSILNTAPGTAGKLDVKGADGDVFVRQATGSNLHVVTDSGTITTVSTVTGITNQVDTNLKQIAGGNTQVAANGLNSTGTGIQTAALVGQLDDAATNTCTENQFCNARITSGGILYMDLSKTAANTNKILVTPDSVALPANQSVNMAQVAGNTTVTAGVNGMLAVGGNTATNVAITSNPVLLGAQAVSSENSAVTTARGVQLVADLVGKLITLPYANPENFVNGTTAAITDTTSTSIIASAGGSLRNYITQITVSNSHASVDTFVKVLEGTNIIWECEAAHAGGGCTATFPVPLKGAAATAINCQPVTTGANVICSASGYKGL